jgi:hypothetical protein
MFAVRQWIATETGCRNSDAEILVDNSSVDPIVYGTLKAGPMKR